MAKIKIQNYPRRDDYLAKDKIFPRPKPPISSDQLSQAIAKAFERCLKDKRGNLKLVDAKTGRLDPLKFQRFVTQRREGVELNDED